MGRGQHRDSEQEDKLGEGHMETIPNNPREFLKVLSKENPEENTVTHGQGALRVI